MYDLLIKNGKIVDGTGNPWFHGDIAIKGDTIVKIGYIAFSETKKVIDANGLVVAPGFIDAHSHSDIRILCNYDAEEKLFQGITTEVVGQCGIGIAPITKEIEPYWRQSLSGIMGDYKETFTWNTFCQYLDYIEKTPKTLNVGALVSYGALRLSVIGMDNRKATYEEIIRMKELLKEALEAGCLGISLGMVYVPTVFASKEEIIEVCKVIGEYKSLISIHIRNEGDYLIESIMEAMEIAENTGARLQISHLKNGGSDKWSKIPKVFSIIENARKKDLDVTFDQYPYDAACTMLKQVLPPWVQSGGDIKMIERLKDSSIRVKIDEQIKNGLPKEEGVTQQGWDNYAKLATWDGLRIVSVKTETNIELEGRTISEVAKDWGKTPVDTVCDLLIEEGGLVGIAIFMMNEEDIKTIIRHPLQSVGSDGLYGSKPHPRLFGTFPRILGKYVREEKVITLEEAVRKMTYASASKYKLKDRGILLEGMKADITIFNEKKIIDKATYEEPKQYPKGIEYVLINGKIVLKKGAKQQIYSGQILKRQY